MRPLHQKLTRDLRRLAGQVVTIALVVAAGIAAYISMKGNYISLLEARDRYYEQSRFGDVFAHLERAPESLRAELEAVPGVARAETRVKAFATIPLATMTRPVGASVLSLSAGSESNLNAVHVVSGRDLEPGRTDEALLLYAFAEAHGIQPGDTLPIVLDGTWRDLRVVGLALSPEYIMAINPGSITQDPKAFAVVWMDRAPLAAAFRMEGAFNDVTLGLQPRASVDAVLEGVDRVLEPYGGLGAIARARQPSNFIIEGELLQLDGMSNVVPAIFLAVAALLLNVVLSRLVHLQRPEIATLKAVGYSNAEVGLHFFELVAVIAVTGALLGVGLGAWLGGQLTDLYGGYFKFPDLAFELQSGHIITAVGISLASAAAGAYFAVRQVVMLPPAEAMRPAAPAKYRRSIIDRLRLSGLVGPSVHMVVRELERRPLRSIASSLAIGASVGLLVVAGWYRDGLDALVKTQFHEVMREDVLVTFTDPRSTRVLGELRHLPGVLDAEGIRMVPVRFRHGHQHREGTIFGYPDDLEMRSARDKWGVPRTLPLEGMRMTETLARVLGLKVGDEVTLEVREGSRPTVVTPVSGLIDDAFGLQGHMRAPVLEALLGQEPLLSAGLLRVDPEHVETLERALKNLPRVAGVTRRADVLQQFEDQSGQMIAVMTLVITLFGATITIGVVYNNARIALSLRARDLASLRVLGYRRREISAILLGEMAVQVLIALPIGMWFGNVLIQGIASTVDPETYRLPIILTEASYGYAAGVALAASAVSALLVRRKLDHLDLIGVLKTRE